MKKNYILNLMKLFSLTAMALGLVFVTSCGGDDEPDPEPEPTQTTAEIIAGNSNLSQLNAFLQADPELKAIIEGSEDYTVFAPNNAAFDKLKTTLGISDLSVIAPNVIGGVLRFHFVKGEKLSAQLYGSSATTEQGESVSVTSAGFVNEAGSDSDGSEILEETRATNGVVYEVETILIPPTVFTAIGTNLATLAQPVLLGSDFTDIVGIIGVADSSVPAGETSIAGILANRSAMYTAFIPANAVFDLAASTLGVEKADLLASFKSSAAVARGFMLNHIAEGQITGDDLSLGLQINMLSGLTLFAAPSDQSPSGWVLLSDLTDPTTAKAIVVLDVYKAVGEDGTLPGATNGSLHVSQPITQ